MTVRASQLREAIRRPLPLDYHPLYRFYEGGSLTRTFRGGDFGRQPIHRGQTFALPASLPVRIRAGREPVRLIRCLGPAVP